MVKGIVGEICVIVVNVYACKYYNGLHIVLLFLAWGPWTEGTCSQTCGTGIRTRTRLCDQPAPAAVNQTCVGESNMTVACNTEPCPGNNI